MKSTIPLSALIIYLLIMFFIFLEVLPQQSSLFDSFQSLDKSYFFFFMFLIIFLESIVYLGFYIPGQFIAVIIVVSSAKGMDDIFLLTITSIIAVTISATINYYLGYYLFKEKKNKNQKISYKKLLLSMIHINTIALFIFEAGSKKVNPKIILITGFLNLPYYFLIILLTYLFKDAIANVSENPFFLGFILLIWYLFSLHQEKKQK